MSELRVLVVEDSEDDALLMLLQLKRGGYQVTHRRVDTPDAMLQALADQWDLVMSDYTMPRFSCPAALTLFTEAGLDCPFIVVTGTIGEESAVALMKMGVSDFVLKTNLPRLSSVVERELREAELRRAKKRAEEALRISEERYKLAMAGANDGLWDWNVVDDSMYFSSRWKHMLGYEDPEIGESVDEWQSRLHPAERQSFRTKLISHLKGLTPHFEIEHRMLHKTSGYRWMLTRGLAVRDEYGRAYRMAGSQTDITERKRAEEQLLHDAFHDGLTGLPNRALFSDLLAFSLEHRQRNDAYLSAVLFLNMERFRYVNDSFGHRIGDQFLIEIASRIRSVLRPGDAAARFGGDEFAVLMDDVRDPAEATRFAEILQSVLGRPLGLGGHEFFPGCSIGVTFSSGGYISPEDMLRDADTAMHRARKRGKKKMEVFDATMHDSAVTTLQLEHELRRAVERREFKVFYQPIVDLKTGRLASFEALIRWPKASGMLVSPNEFIPLAEELGLIVEIGKQVLEMACIQMVTWQRTFPGHQLIPVSVNLSGKQFSQPDLVEEIEGVIGETGLSASHLKLEITETMLMENPESARLMLTRLREKNIKVLMDDFGTGYSSLSYLHRFPCDTLKIDGSFVSRITEEIEGKEIVRIIVMLAHNLGMNVIAECVETAEHLEVLRELNCDLAQGYYFARPLDAEAATELIRTNPTW
ncbi:diguanylate cyclase (GGDEF)-like protein/PAS domain S-box-containing protein [Chitinivorax tropicus]|uniref:Diguanylate cyclase (GGDEF)-like protein/PAS domain S-box-containing protein n=1 Tax=Chitinivorax tropicus TaxID=714531 RepID=A0A840MJQ1_9PROT|nr:diguanylate cyclase (GGDEF)-like protein/PAS domain S-box-containing protein [Chitinivorax tropicus]